MTGKKAEPRLWDEETKQKALADLEAGRSAREIAEEIGAHSSTVYYWKNNNVKQSEEAEPKARPKRASNGHSNGASALSEDERSELIALRIEVKRLRKILAAAL